MTDTSLDDRLREEISHLRAQNRRYRELIQNLSSMVEILSKRLEGVQLNPSELRAFETFGGDSGPPASPLKNSPGPARALLRKIQISRRGTPVDTKPLVPNPGWKCLVVDQPQIRIGFTLFGMTAEAVERAVGEVEHRQVRSRDFTPVFVTDTSDLRSFRARGYVVEYIPASIISSAKERRTDGRYLNARFELIKEKWGLGEIVDLGRSNR